MDDRSSVLDIGCGAGAASLPLAPPARHLIAVDSQATMLDALEAVARQRDLRVTRVDGQWPDVADRVGGCDVVVCLHVFYNVAALGPFAVALSAHATKRGVVELHAVHPWVDLGPLWQRVHGQPRPAGRYARTGQILARSGQPAELRPGQRAGRQRPARRPRQPPE